MDCWPLCHPGLFGYISEKLVKTVQRCREEARKERKQVFVASWRFGWKHRKSCSAGCCLILMHCGSSPLVNLLTQSCHWVTAMAHYSFLFWPELAESCYFWDLAPATLTLSSKEVKPCWLSFKVRCDKEKKKTLQLLKNENWDNDGREMVRQWGRSKAQLHGSEVQQQFANMKATIQSWVPEYCVLCCHIGISHLCNLAKITLFMHGYKQYRKWKYFSHVTLNNVAQPGQWVYPTSVPSVQGRLL